MLLTAWSGWCASAATASASVCLTARSDNQLGDVGPSPVGPSQGKCCPQGAFRNAWKNILLCKEDKGDIKHPGQ